MTKIYKSFDAWLKSLDHPPDLPEAFNARQSEIDLLKLVLGRCVSHVCPICKANLRQFGDCRTCHLECGGECKKKGQHYPDCILMKLIKS